jgi:hypothetical protein
MSTTRAQGTGLDEVPEPAEGDQERRKPISPAQADAAGAAAMRIANQESGISFYQLIFGEKHRLRLLLERGRSSPEAVTEFNSSQPPDRKLLHYQPQELDDLITVQFSQLTDTDKREFAECLNRTDGWNGGLPAALHLFNDLRKARHQRPLGYLDSDDIDALRASYGPDAKHPPTHVQVPTTPATPPRKPAPPSASAPAHHEAPTHAAKPHHEHEDEALTDHQMTVLQPFKGKVVTQTSPGLRLRSGPSLHASIIDVIPREAELTVFAGKAPGGFFHVEFHGRRGYAHSSCIRKVGDLQTPEAHPAPAVHAPQHRPPKKHLDEERPATDPELA